MKMQGFIAKIGGQSGKRVYFTRALIRSDYARTFENNCFECANTIILDKCFQILMEGKQCSIKAEDMKYGMENSNLTFCEITFKKGQITKIEEKLFKDLKEEII